MRTEIKSVRRPVFEDKLSQEELKEEILKGKRAIDEGRYLSVDELRAVLADMKNGRVQTFKESADHFRKEEIAKRLKEAVEDEKTERLYSTDEVFDETMKDLGL